MKIKYILGSFIFLLLGTFLYACSTFETYTWLDADGTVLYSGTSSKSLPLPSDTEAWSYVEWESTGENEKTAKREPKYSYFVGNVFQIIVYDLGKIPISSGSGFIFNDEGWFVTNNHVMDEGYYAEAIFDIPDIYEGRSFTKLDIDLASYSDSNKDVFVGRVSNYFQLKDYYKEFKFNTNYKVGDLTYSVGYPDSSIKLQINKGNIQKDLSSLYDKIYSGVTYIGSTSFIAPGSSGGILVNSNLEVLGMTTIGVEDKLGNFVLGGAIEAFNYLNQIKTVKYADLKDYALFVHPNEVKFINFFKNKVVKNKNYKFVGDDYWSAYIWKYYDSDEYYVEQGGNAVQNGTLLVDSDGWMESERSIYWESGSRMEMSFYGYYSHSKGIDNFCFEFKYTFSDGNWYALKSTDINYSSIISLTLNNYSITNSYYGRPSQSNIDYAKNVFNIEYEWITKILDN